MGVKENFTEKFIVARNFKIIKDFKGAEQAEIAKKTNISKQNLSLWENMGGNPGKKFIDRLAKYFDVPREVFYKDDLTTEYLQNMEKSNPSTEETAKEEKPEAVASPEKKMIDEVFRKVVEGETEYLLIPRQIFEGHYRFVPLEEIASHEKELDRKDHQIQGLYEIVKLIVSTRPGTELPKLEQTEKNTGV